jgi:hypothetical protein
MNLATKAPDGEWYVIGVCMLGEGDWLTRTRCLYANGYLRVVGGEFHLPSREAAERKARELVKTKVKNAKHREVSISELPDVAADHLVVDAARWVSPEEMLRMVKNARNERYVVFSDVTGLTDRFDEGLEYIGMVENDEYLLVYDREGVLCPCHVSRFSEIRPTEDAIEAGVLTHGQGAVNPCGEVAISGMSLVKLFKGLNPSEGLSGLKLPL